MFSDCPVDSSAAGIIDVMLAQALGDTDGDDIVSETESFSRSDATSLFGGCRMWSSHDNSRAVSRAVVSKPVTICVQSKRNPLLEFVMRCTLPYKLIGRNET
jgi:hypothetical protein